MGNTSAKPLDYAFFFLTLFLLFVSSSRDISYLIVTTIQSSVFLNC